MPKRKTLTIARETLRQLTRADLRRAAGGTDTLDLSCAGGCLADTIGGCTIVTPPDPGRGNTSKFPCSGAYYCDTNGCPR